MTTYRFPQSERLKSRNEIEVLFLEGESIYKYPLRIKYITSKRSPESIEPIIKVAFSVPKRKIRKAVERNLIKRRMIEAYRLHRMEYIDRHTLSQEKLSLQLIFIYQQNEILEYKIIEKAVIKLLNKVSGQW